MKRYILTLTFILAGAIAFAQSMRIELKNGNIIYVPTTSIEKAKCTDDTYAAANISDYKLELEQVEPITTSTIYDEKIQLFVPKTVAADYGFEHEYYDVTLTNTTTGRQAECRTDDNGKIENDGRYSLDNIVDYSPEYTPIKVDVVEYLRYGDAEFTANATTTLMLRKSDRTLEDTYYLLGDINGWTASDSYKFKTPAGNLYGGNPFTLSIKPQKNTTISFRIVPASKVNGNYKESFGLSSHMSDNYDQNGRIFLYVGYGSDYSDITIDTGDADELTLSAYLCYDLLTVQAIKSDSVYKNCYTNLGFSNMQKDPNDNDIDGLYGSQCDMIRQLVNANDLASDEAVCGWVDQGIYEFNYSMSNPDNPLTYGLYLRLQKGVSLCNQYLSLNTSDMQKNAEVRTLRAYYNLQLLDLFRSYPYYTTTEDYKQYSAQEIFSMIESDLTCSLASLSEQTWLKSTDANYGRMSKAAAWMLLARLYLNAEVYTGTPKWQEAKEYADKVINCDAYSLCTSSTGTYTAYQMLFMGDNGETDAAREAILPIRFDGKDSQSWGGTTFLIGATHSSDMPDCGTYQQWSGIRALPTLVNSVSDDRALFYSTDRSLEANNISDFRSGYSITKFSNLGTDGQQISEFTNYASTDFFLIRLAEAYLTAGEAAARMGDNAKAAEYINIVRTRAHAETYTSYTLDDICDEWMREFYMEGRRRSDLVRFNKFGGNVNYNWQWKGGVCNGSNISLHYNIYPIPQQVIENDNNILQNPGY